MIASRLCAATLLMLLTAVSVGCGGKRGVEVGALSLGAAPPGASMRAGYVTIINHDARARRLTHASSPAYEIVEFHISESKDGVARMRQEKEIPVAAKSQLRFEAYGRHLMLMRPTAAAQTEPLTVQLCFADGECVSATTAPRR